MANTGEPTDSGGRNPVISDKQILRPFVTSNEPVLTAPEIAKKLPISKTGVYKRLRNLDENGLVNSKKIGRGKAWWITEDGEDLLKDD
jgi:predicted transcriptional regulator